jgi:hypothetical protein
MDYIINHFYSVNINLWLSRAFGFGIVVFFTLFIFK